MPEFLEKNHFDKRTLVYILTVSLLAVAGIWLLAYSTPYGLGLNDDSIAYIAGARSIIEGNGYREAWLASNGPVTHFPPGFPAVLALIGSVTGLDPIRGARALNGILFGLNIALTGWVGSRMTGSRVGGVVAAALVLLSGSLLNIHARAMSEPLYLFFMLLAFLLLDYYFQGTKNIYLVALGFMLGWAFLARYAALALLVTMAAVLLSLHARWKERLSSVLVLSLSAFPWIIGWTIRNRIVAGNFTNRVLGWHPITVENWGLGIETVAEFLVPLRSLRNDIYSVSGLFEIIVIGIVLAVFVFVLRTVLPRFLQPQKVPRPAVLPVSHGMYVVAYLTLLVVTMTLFDPATKFQVRILSPILLSILLLFIFLLTWFWQRSPYPGKTMIVLSILCLSFMFAYGQIQLVQSLRQGGGSFANERWSDSEAIAALNRLPEETLILSNEPGVVYLYTGRPSGVLPKSEPGISRIKQPVLDGEIVIALFRVNKADGQTLDYYYDLGTGLRLTDYSNAWLYSAFPEQEQ